MPTPAATQAPSTKSPTIGETVLFCLEPGIWRPLLVTSQGARQLCGVVTCEPTDGNLQAFREGIPLPGILYGSPTRLSLTVFAAHLRQGSGVGEWRWKA